MLSDRFILKWSHLAADLSLITVNRLYSRCTLWLASYLYDYVIKADKGKVFVLTSCFDFEKS